MGCGASKNDVIKKIPDTEKTEQEWMNGKNVSKEQQGKEINANDSEERSKVNDTYKSEGNTQPDKKEMILPPVKPPKGIKSREENNSSVTRTEPIAFEVPIDDMGSSIIKKHPPKRLRQLVETPPSIDLTQETLDEKVTLANERRTKVLNQRVASARQKSGKNGNRIKMMAPSAPFQEDCDS